MKRILVALACIALYRAGHLLAIPWWDRSGFDQLGWSMPSVFALGITPFAAGFVLVELFSLTVARRLREKGLEGRARLNRGAVGVGLAFAAVEALGVALYLDGNPDIWSMQSTPLTVFTTTVTLLAGSVACFGLAGLISAHGLGNGFSVLIAVDILCSPFWLPWRPRHTQALDPELLSQALPAMLMALLVVALFFSRGLGRAMPPERAAEQPVAVDVPVFPQGVLPLYWASALLSRLVFWVDPEFEVLGIWSYAALEAVGIVLLSWLGWTLFSNRQRLRTNLAGLAVAQSAIGTAAQGQFVRALLLTVGAAGAISIFESYVLDGWGVPLGLVQIIVLAAVVADVVAEWRLRRRASTVDLIELDNVWLAAYLRAVLQRDGVDVALRGYLHRSLFFFFFPLVKITVLVAERDRARAAEILERVRPSISIA